MLLSSAFKFLVIIIILALALLHIIVEVDKIIMPHKTMVVATGNITHNYDQLHLHLSNFFTKLESQLGFICSRAVTK
jgi:hypothetical protein